MGTNYLKKYYLDDDKLAQRARLEFYRSLSTGRMIAFVGSMATQAFGYGSWDQLRLTFTALALDALKEGETDPPTPRLKAALDQIAEFHINGVRGYWDGQVGMSLIEEVLDRFEAMSTDNPRRPVSTSTWPLDHANTKREALRERLAQSFRHRREGWQIDRPSIVGSVKDFSRRFDVPRALWELLGIRRFATPSYDFELERTAMLSDRNEGDAREDVSPGSDPFEALAALRGSRSENFGWDLGSGRIRRTFSDGWAIESDLLNRERIAGASAQRGDGRRLHAFGRR